MEILNNNLPEAQPIQAKMSISRFKFSIAWATNLLLHFIVAIVSIALAWKSDFFSQAYNSEAYIGLFIAILYAFFFSSIFAVLTNWPYIGKLFVIISLVSGSVISFYFFKMPFLSSAQYPDLNGILWDLLNFLEQPNEEHYQNILTIMQDDPTYVLWVLLLGILPAIRLCFYKIHYQSSFLENLLEMIYQLKKIFLWFLISTFIILLSWGLILKIIS